MSVCGGEGGGGQSEVEATPPGFFLPIFYSFVVVFYFCNCIKKGKLYLKITTDICAEVAK